MLAAALTLWMMFSFWLASPTLGLPPVVGRIAGTLLCAELVALLLWSYGTEDCEERTCAPLGQAAGIAARTDVPLLAAALTAVVALRLAWSRPAARAGIAEAVSGRDGRARARGL